MSCALLADMYTGIWDGAPLGSNDYVICADEETSIQARCQPLAHAPPARNARRPGQISFTNGPVS